MDKDIEFTWADGLGGYWHSGTKLVSDLYVYQEYKKAVKIIRELEKRIELFERKINPPIDFDETEQEMFLAGAR